jgi:hypothetical protein
MGTVVEEGLALLASRPAVTRVTTVDGAQLGAGELPSLLALLLARLDEVTAQNVELRARLEEICDEVEHVRQQVLATRIRRAVRDDMGMILYVVDEVMATVDDDDGLDDKEY